MAGHFTAALVNDPPLFAVPVSVYEAGTDTLATLFTDKTGATTTPNPTTTDQYGSISIYATPGGYVAKLAVRGLTVSIPFAVDEHPDFANVIQSLAPAAGALTIDASLGSIVEVSPSGNVSGTTVDNLQVGQRFVLDFISDGTHTFTYPTICKFAGGSHGSASSTSGYKDRYEFIYDGSYLVEVARSLAIH